MFHLLLYQPEIPPNTGNLIRLCANTGFKLHLIEPIGFSLSEKAFRRAGLDYHEAANLQVHASLDTCLNDEFPKQARVFACSTHASTPYTEPRYIAGDVFLFGPETRGLPASVMNDSRVLKTIRIPMRPHSRSINLSNAVAIVAYEAWRQTGFDGSTE